VDEFLRIHKPSKEAEGRAKAEGIDLLALKETNPLEYKMRASQEMLQTSRDFIEIASQVFFAAFPHHELFRYGEQQISLLSFPELSAKDLERWDKAMGRLVEHPTYSRDYLYYRVVNSSQGEKRQLALPINPADWQGQVDMLVGPFAHQQQAMEWAEAIKPEQLMVDTLQYQGYWFCDLFLLNHQFNERKP
jgi:hypothetical protein